MSIFDTLFDDIKATKIDGFADELKSLYIYNKYKQENQNILVVTSNLTEASKLYNKINPYTDNVWLFPMDDFITSEAIAVSPEFKVNRLETLNNVLLNKGIVITNLMGYLRYLPGKEKFKNSKIVIKNGKEYDINKLIDKLYSIGYKRQTTVNMTGEIAVRGYVLDIFPVSSEVPIRIEFWGDEVDSIRTFNVDTQLTIKKIKEVSIYPNTELLIDEDNFDKPHRILNKYDDTTSIVGYLDNPIIIYNNLNDLKVNYNFLIEEIMNYNISLELSADTKYMYDFNELYDNKAIIFEELNDSIDNKTIKKASIENFNGNSEEINIRLNKYLCQGKCVVICLDSRYKINKLMEYLNNPNIVYTNENNLFLKKINIINKKMAGGFSYDKYIIITETELYGKKEENGYKTKFRLGSKIKDVTKLEIGDYVVHSINGIGYSQ